MHDILNYYAFITANIYYVTISKNNHNKTSSFVSNNNFDIYH